MKLHQDNGTKKNSMLRREIQHVGLLQHTRDALLKGVAVAMVLLALSASAPAAGAAILDSFTATSFPGVLLSSPGLIDHDDIGVPGVAGGDRHLEVAATMAMSLVNSAIFEIFDGQANYASGPMADGWFRFTYDGATLAQDIGGILGEITLNFVSFDYAFEQPMEITIALFDGVTTATATHQLNTMIAGPTPISFLVADFVNGDIIDAGQLTSISILFDARQAQDLQLASIETRLIPEPSTLALLALGAVGFCAVVVRNRRPSTA